LERPSGDTLSIATIRFIRDRTGRVSGHVFHQLGLDEIAKKIET